MKDSVLASLKIPLHIFSQALFLLQKNFLFFSLARVDCHSFLGHVLWSVVERLSTF